MLKVFRPNGFCCLDFLIDCFETLTFFAFLISSKAVLHYYSVSNSLVMILPFANYMVNSNTSLGGFFLTSFPSSTIKFNDGV